VSEFLSDLMIDRFNERLSFSHFFNEACYFSLRFYVCVYI